MSDITQLQKDLDSIRDALLSAGSQCKDRATIGRSNAAKMSKFNAELKLYETKISEIKETINYMVKEYKSIEKYLVDKKELSIELLQIAIEKAGLVVPDADVAGTHLAFKDKSAKILNNKGQDINLREGSAYRTIMGILMRYSLLKAQPEAIQLMLLDEAFSTLSDVTASTMREYLDAFKDDMLIVGIEQRNYLYDGIDRITYEVLKGEDGISRVRKVI